MRQQGRLAFIAHPGNLINHRFTKAARPQPPVIGQGKTVGLVTGTLKHIQRLGIGRQPQRNLTPGRMDLLEAFRQSDDRDARIPQGVDFSQGSI